MVVLLEGVAAPGRTWANVHKNVLTAIRFFNAARREIRPNRLNAAHGSGTGEKWKHVSATRHGLSAMQRTRMGIRAKQGALEAANHLDSLDDHAREVNSDEAWKARMRLRTHPAIAEELHRWWVMIRTSFKLNDTVGFVVYARLQMALYKCLLTPYDEDDARRCAASEWKQDCKGAKGLDRVLFCDTIFEAADIWTRSVDVDEYVAWLRTVLAAIAPAGKLLSPAEIDPLVDGALEALVDAAMSDPTFGRPFSQGSNLGGASARAARARLLADSDEELAAAMERRRQRVAAFGLEAGLSSDVQKRLADRRAAEARALALSSMAKQRGGMMYGADGDYPARPLGGTPRGPGRHAAGGRGYVPGGGAAGLGASHRFVNAYLSPRGAGRGGEQGLSARPLTATEALLNTYGPMHTLTSLSPFVLVSPLMRLSPPTPGSPREATRVLQIAVSTPRGRRRPANE